MSQLRRLVRWALQPAAARVIHTLVKQNADLQHRNRALKRDRDAAVERNHQHIRNAYQATENVRAFTAAFDQLRAEYERLVDALAYVSEERDKALADLEDARENVRVAKRALADANTENAVLVGDKTDLRGQIEDLTLAKRLWDKHLAGCPVAQAIADEDAAKARSNR